MIVNDRDGETTDKKIQIIGESSFFSNLVAIAVFKTEHFFNPECLIYETNDIEKEVLDVQICDSLSYLKNEKKMEKSQFKAIAQERRIEKNGDGKLLEIFFALFW